MVFALCSVASIVRTLIVRFCNMPMRTLTDELAAFMRESLPAALNESKELGRETVETVI